MIRLVDQLPPPMQRSLPMPHSLRGQFTTPVGGDPVAFDTTLGTIARIEDSCGDRSIMEVLNGVVFGRRATDQMLLLAAALEATGKPAADAKALAERATVPEAEAFVLALMGALGFKLAPRAGEDADVAESPLAGSSAGGAGAVSRSAA